MNTQYGKSAALPDYVPQWKVDAIIARYRFLMSDDAAWLDEQIAAGIAEYGDGDDECDSGVHQVDWRSEVNERGENIRVFTSERGYW